MSYEQTDCLKYIGVILALAGCAVGSLVFGYVHDDNFSNPDYAACRRRGYAMPECMRRLAITGEVR
ncbi:hypothetical protein [Komagataeibacter xylinus]|uniref:hypothetical protein n=1 Tax=Komagataeibacter xylinus TaxID=28448 RepID=UPI00280C0FD0|nr:hypothetical protein [Komagataeibacter xylinus]